MEKDFDVDVSFDQPADDKLISSMSEAELQLAISKLPHELLDAARGILIQRRSYSDVSQELGIRQPELVRAIHRAKLLIAESR